MFVIEFPCHMIFHGHAGTWTQCGKIRPLLSTFFPLEFKTLNLAAFGAEGHGRVLISFKDHVKATKYRYMI